MDYSIYFSLRCGRLPTNHEKSMVKPGETTVKMDRVLTQGSTLVLASQRHPRVNTGSSIKKCKGMEKCNDQLERTVK